MKNLDAYITGNWGENQFVDDEPLYPDVSVTVGDGNAFAVMGAVSTALRRAGYADAVSAYRTEAMSGDYEHLLQVSMKYVWLDGEDDE